MNRKEEARELKRILKKMKKEELSLEEKEFLFEWIKKISRKLKLKFKIDKTFWEDWVSESYIQVFRSVCFFKENKKAVPWLIGLISQTALNLYKEKLKFESNVIPEPEPKSDTSENLIETFFSGLEKVLETKLSSPVREEILQKLISLSDEGKLLSTKIGIRSHLLKILEEYFPEVYVKRRAILEFLSSLREKK